MSDEHPEILSWHVATNSYELEPGTLFVTTTLWMECPEWKDGFEKDPDYDQENCDTCSGPGNLHVNLADLLDDDSNEALDTLIENIE